jgi:hypothetical protein
MPEEEKRSFDEMATEKDIEKIRGCTFTISLSSEEADAVVEALIQFVKTHARMHEEHGNLSSAECAKDRHRRAILATLSEQFAHYMDA